MRIWAEKAHRATLVLLLVAEVAQFYAAGLLVYGRPTVHAVNGWMMILAALIILILAAIHRRSRRQVVGSVLLAALVALQPVFVFALYGVSIYLAALHPVNALLIVALTVWLIAEGPSRAQPLPSASS